VALLEAKGITKAYPGVQALSGVDFSVDAGEVHALLGENGAGKSTLMKIIAGSVVPDSGRVEVDGHPLRFGSPEEARASGVSIVHQELSLVPSLSIAENVLLGRWAKGRAGIDWRGVEEGARRHLERVGLDTEDSSRRVSELSMAERQLVETAKALSTEPKVLLLDEPTSALSEPEAERLFEIIGDLTQGSVAVIYVSHRLAEAMRLADEITVLRDGHHVATRPAGEVTEDELARLMVGRDVRGALVAGQIDTERGENVALRLAALKGYPRIGPIDLDVHVGEVVTVFGLVGSGRSDLARIVFGIEPATGGHIEVMGATAAIHSPGDAIDLSIGYVAPDRSMGVVPRLSVAANVTLASLSQLGRGPSLDFDRERELAERYIGELDIRVDSPDRPAGDLSGGNQQKTILARWLCTDARVLILDDPTRGIDVGAKEEVYRLVRSLADRGTAVLYLTSEISEARALGDRILVMAGGEIVQELPPRAEEEHIMAAAGGVRG
jgi:ribose transport system ATP-binding protein